MRSHLRDETALIRADLAEAGRRRREAELNGVWPAVRVLSERIDRLLDRMLEQHPL